MMTRVDREEMWYMIVVGSMLACYLGAVIALLTF